MQQQQRASAHRSPYLQQPRNQMVLPAQQQQGTAGSMSPQVLPAQLQQQEMGLCAPLTFEAETLQDHQAVLTQQQLRARHFEHQQRQADAAQQQQLQWQHRLLAQQQQHQHQHQQHQALMASSSRPDVFANRISPPDVGPAAQLQNLPALLHQQAAVLQQQAVMLQQQGHAQAAAGALDLQGVALQRAAPTPQQAMPMLMPIDRLTALRQSLGSGAGAVAAAAQRQDHMDASQHRDGQVGQVTSSSSSLWHRYYNISVLGGKKACRESYHHTAYVIGRVVS